MTREPSPPTEIEDALRSARRDDTVPSQKWPARDINKIVEIKKKPGPTLVAPDITQEDAIDILFPGNPLLCVGASSANFATKRREEWRGKLKFNSLIVPSPMTATTGKTKAGHLSAHSLDNTGPRRFIVCEFDWGDWEGQQKLGFYLARLAPLAAVVFSGGKSYHHWYFCANDTEDTILHFFKTAVSLGADKRMWLKSQFARLPNGTRDSGVQQKIWYFNPEVIK
jgi:hypothetical protein